MIGEYEDELPEALLLADVEGTVHVMKGETYGKYFSKHVTYESNDKEVHEQIDKIYDMIMIENFKVVSIIEKKE